MDAIHEAVKFLLDHAVKFGDGPTSTHARGLLAKVDEHLAGLGAISLPHEGTQSPQAKIEELLGGASPRK